VRDVDPGCGVFSAGVIALATERTKRDPESLLVTECLYRIDPGRKVGGDERG